MIVFHCISRLLLLLLVARQVRSAQPRLNSKQKTQYEAHLRFLRSIHGAAHGFRPTEYLSHLLPAHPNIEEEAWQFARSSGNGPVLWTLDGKERNIFATTRLPSQSQLGSKWNLSWRDSPKDAYAFWQVKGSKHKLLRLDAWPTGANPAESTTIEWILERIRCAAANEVSRRPHLLCFGSG